MKRILSDGESSSDLEEDDEEEEEEEEDVEPLPEALPLPAMEVRDPSEIERFFCVIPGTPEEKWVAFVCSSSARQDRPSVWQSSSGEVFSPISANPAKRVARGRMMSSPQADWGNSLQESLAVWVPCGDGQLRTSDGRLFFSLDRSDAPSFYCRQAFPCKRDFAPCVPVGHRASGTLIVTRLVARRSDVESMRIDLAIVNGGCRPR